VRDAHQGSPRPAVGSDHHAGVTHPSRGGCSKMRWARGPDDLLSGRLSLDLLHLRIALRGNVTGCPKEELPIFPLTAHRRSRGASMSAFRMLATRRELTGLNFQRRLIAAGLPRMRFQQLRHSAPSLMLGQGSCCGACRRSPAVSLAVSGAPVVGRT
jgi:hypothetical protein